MCKSLHCPLHSQNCGYCLNSVEGEPEETSSFRTDGNAVCHG